MSREPPPETTAAGAVLWRPAGAGGVEIALVHRPRYDDWSLPKGKLHDGETSWAAAAREVLEETGFPALLGRHLGRIRYRVSTSGRRKAVDYFAARAGAGAFRPNDEVDLLRWLPAAEAHTLLSYQGDREVLLAFTELPADLATVLLVRHANAGHRAQWRGDDRLRPLTPHGWRQVAVLDKLFAVFGVDYVYSAPPLRCRQTVSGFAEAIGTDVHVEPLLSDAGFGADSDAGAARVLDIAASGGTSLISSQGEVIPKLVSRLADGAGLHVAPLVPAKASVWVLSFTGGRLVAAHHIPAP